ncbi:hypothetical protein Pcinc_025047 [Petrolisthes cinctipes]|uniref:Uncharacterized protein n=1 Tax=Petrolisthes cinctipes TaxID=88211 RepID=A0AAE1F9Y7_PETCI|nr:hypothetical protein Pcinc_025047 [Petrolisthes cinctipes]
MMPSGDAQEIRHGFGDPPHLMLTFLWKLAGQALKTTCDIVGKLQVQESLKYCYDTHTQTPIVGFGGVGTTETWLPAGGPGLRAVSQVPPVHQNDKIV